MPYTWRSGGRYRIRTTRYTVNYTRMPAALAALAKQLLELEAAGDRARTDAWFARYGSMPPELKTALAAAADIPADIHPAFSFPGKLP